MNLGCGWRGEEQKEGDRGNCISGAPNMTCFKNNNSQHTHRESKNPEEAQFQQLGVISSKTPEARLHKDSAPSTKLAVLDDCWSPKLLSGLIKV